MLSVEGGGTPVALSLTLIDIKLDYLRYGEYKIFVPYFINFIFI